MKTSEKKSKTDPFLTLTWFDLESWAGRKVLSRGKSYQHSGYVKEFGITGDGELVAWVQGTKPYATKVGFKKNKLTSSCTCPYGASCKHAVALVVEYLERMKNKKDVPIISAGDERLRQIKRGHTEWPDDYNNDFDGGEEIFDDDESGSKTTESAGDVGTYLKSKSKDDLAAILSEIAERHPEVQSELNFKAGISSKSVNTLVKTIKKEIDRVSNEPGWYDYRRHTGYSPDYSSVKSGMEKLLESGKPDEVVKLGGYLFAKGSEQIGQSNDENQTVDEVANAMSVVFDALKVCSMPDVDKMEKALDWKLEDGYCICDGFDKFWKRKFGKKDWSLLADRLFERLKGLKIEPGSREFHSTYQRDKMTDRIIEALVHAGRNDEIIPLCLREAEMTGSYNRLIEQLRGAGKLDEAEKWIRKGVEATDKIKHGIVGDLIEHLLEIRTAIRDWPFVAAVRADEFFDNPSLETFKKLIKSAEKAKVLEPVQNAAMNYLRTGKLPRPGSEEWPLPKTGLVKLEKNGYSRLPFTAILIDIALFEKNIDEALRLYDGGRQGNRQDDNFNSSWGEGMHSTIASAIKAKYPDRAVEIWKHLALYHIGFSNPKGYSLAANYLRKIQKILTTQNKDTEWKRYLAALRAEHKRKIRLLEILDSMSGKRIIEG
ncbi:MAG: hypothetical protein PHC61_04465 [Chitinivibrionales bacterium]|nr:hypothetical protein [Chitinivibrionales bacterium]